MIGEATNTIPILNNFCSYWLHIIPIVTVKLTKGYNDICGSLFYYPKM